MEKSLFFKTVDNTNFFKGMGRVLDIGSTRNKRSFKMGTSHLIDNNDAIAHDWEMVGKDIWGAYEQFKKEA